MMEMKVRDKYNMETEKGVYTVVIVNINDFREPEAKYMLDIYQDEKYLGEVFCGDQFFKRESVTKVR